MFGITRIFEDPIQFLITFIALVVSIGIHEFAHVLSAYLQGDPTGKTLGRLTLNPIKHLDVVGTLAIIFIGLGWGKPAPFNPFALRYRRWGPALVAIAGPISNLIMVLLAGYALLLVSPILETGNLLRLFLTTLVILNAALAMFNLIPIHPLDGSHLLRSVLGQENALVQTLERYGMFILLGLLVFAGGALSLFIFGGMRIILSIFGLSSLL